MGMFIFYSTSLSSVYWSLSTNVCSVAAIVNPPQACAALFGAEPKQKYRSGGIKPKQLHGVLKLTVRITSQSTLERIATA